jgi:uncharacterized OsmC-like protein
MTMESPAGGQTLRLCCGEEEGSFRLVVTGAQEVRIETGGSGLEIEARETDISPYHLLAGSLGICTVMTVAGWAGRAGIDSRSLSVLVRWALADERPARVESYQIEILWPDLAEERVQAANRAASACPIHATLARSVGIHRTVRISRRTEYDPPPTRAGIVGRVGRTRDFEGGPSGPPHTHGSGDAGDGTVSADELPPEVAER